MPSSPSRKKLSKYMKIRKGDKVVIIKGKDRGKSGAVITVFPKRGMVSVEGLNIFSKHRRPKRQGEKGEVIKVLRPIQASNVMLWCSNCRKGVRLGFRRDGA